MALNRYQKVKFAPPYLELYNKDAIVAEPAGALSIAALEFHRDEIKGKKENVLSQEGTMILTE